jgi:flagellar biosynthesis repressor protein FlbT
MRRFQRGKNVGLKLELKPNERVLLGDCVLTNSDQRTRITIDGSLPILREKDIMAVGQADSPAKLIYLALQFMYLAKKPNDNYALYIRLARDTLKAAPGTKSLIDRINNHILSGNLYKALREARKLIAYEKEHSHMRPAGKAVAKSGMETASPRELEAVLLLKAAAKLQAIQGSWTGKKPRGLDDALLYNRRLWMVFIDAVARDGNKLPKQVRENIALLGLRVLSDTVRLMTRPEPTQLTALIDINRGIAAGLRGRK